MFLHDKVVCSHRLAKSVHRHNSASIHATLVCRKLMAWEASIGIRSDCDYYFAVEVTPTLRCHRSTANRHCNMRCTHSEFFLHGRPLLHGRETLRCWSHES